MLVNIEGDTSDYTKGKYRKKWYNQNESVK